MSLTDQSQQLEGTNLTHPLEKLLVGAESGFHAPELGNRLAAWTLSYCRKELGEEKFHQALLAAGASMLQLSESRAENLHVEALLGECGVVLDSPRSMVDESLFPVGYDPQ